MAPAVHFSIYRQYTKARQSANNAMVSFLAGSALASHTLQLTTGSNRLLPEIFPAVPHITRFNLRPDAAADVLGAAGPHLATVTIPYALAIHEDALVRGDRAEYSLLDVFSVFAVTKGLGRGVNALLQAGLTQEHWAKACVDDYREESSRTRNSEAWGRGLIGHARDRYGAVGLSKPHLFRAAFDKGAWLDPTKYP